jgi:hypothetical protein
MEPTARRHTRGEDHRQAVIADGHPLTVDAIGGAEHRLCEGSCQPGDEGLLLGAPGRQGTDPHGHQRLAAALAGEKPLPATGTIVVRDADASAMAGEEVPRD